MKQHKIMEGNTKYIISLNNIDISYLQRLFDRKDCDTVPIWSVTNTDKNFDEFYEFELFAKVKKETISESDENNSVEQCYICDTSVPTTYIQNHYASDKHRTCAAIIRHALLRATRHAQSVPLRHTGSATQPVPHACSSGDVAYFCDHCSLAVKLKNKDAHEKTKEHQVSVIHDRLLNGLLVTYLDKNKIVADSRYEAKASHARVDSTVEEELNEDDVAKKFSNETDITDDESCTTDPDKGKESKLDEDGELIIFRDDHQCMTNNEDVANASYLILCDETTELCDENWNSQFSKPITNQTKNKHEDAVSSVEQDTVEISSLKIKVPTNNYHGFVKTWAAWPEKGNFSCLICQKVAVDKDKHKMEPHHIELISKPVRDLNCTRQINEVWHHCIICNKMVQNKELHISTKSHKSKLYPLELTRKQLQLQKKAENEFNCDICKCSMSIKTKELHLNGARHAANLLRIINTADNCVLHYHFKKFQGDILCIICNVLVHDDIDKHLESNAHDVSYKSFLVENQITVFNKSFRCHACNYTYKQNYMHETDHVKSAMHKLKLSVYKPKSSEPANLDSIEDIDFLDFDTIKLLYFLESSDEPKKVKCKVCKNNIESKSASIKKHLAKDYHEFNLKALLLVNNLKVKLNGSYFCETCRSTIDFTKEIDHINSDDHMGKVKSIQLSLREREDDISRAATSKEDNPTYKGYVLDHNNAEKIATRTPEIGMESNEYASEILKSTESFESKQLVHIMNKSKSIEDNKEKNLYETNVSLTCDIDFLDDDTAQFLYLFESSDKFHRVTCKVCKVDIKSVSTRMKKHVSKQAHQSNLEFLLFVNKIKNKFDGAYFCEVCRSTINVSKEIDHINSGHHKINMINVQPSLSWREKDNNTTDDTKENNHKRNVRTSPLSWRERDDNVQKAAISSVSNLTSNAYVLNDNTVDKLTTKPAVSSISNLTSNAYILDSNIVEKLATIPTEISTKSNESADETLKPSKSLKFNQLLQMNKLRLIEYGEYYCDLCAINVASKTVVEHVQCKIHLDNLVENSNEKDKNISEYYCEACQTRVNNIYYVIDIHNRSVQHRLNLKILQKEKKNNTEEHKLNTVFFNFGYMFDSTDKWLSVKCKVCQHTMQNSKSKILRHVESSKHLISLNLLLTKNKLQIQFTGKYLCKFCNDSIELMETLNHINSEKHINNTKTEKKITMYLANSNAEQEIIAAEEEESITNNSGKLQINENQSLNASAKLENCAQNNIDVHEVNTHSFASTSTVNSKATENDVINSLKKEVETSSEKLISYKVISCFDADEGNLQVSSFTGSSEVNKLTKQDMNNCLLEVPSKPGVMCVICDTVVPKTDANIRDHLKGKRHKSHYVNFLNNNKPVTVVDKSSCDINVTVKNPMKLAQTDTSKSLALLEDPIFKYVEGVLFCRCCNTEVTCTEKFINTHLTGWRHKVKSSAMLAENGLRVDKDKIYCDVCEIHLPNLNGIKHIDSLSHKTKVSAKAVEYTAKMDETKMVSKHLISLNPLSMKNKSQIQSTGKHLCEFRNDNVELMETLDHKITMNLANSNAEQEITAAEKEESIINMGKLQLTENQLLNASAKLKNCAENKIDVREVKTQSFAATSTVNNKATEKCAINSLKNEVDTSSEKLIRLTSRFDANQGNLQVGSITGSSEVNKLTKQEMNDCLLEVPSKPSEVMCVICDTVVPKTDANIRDHLKGKRHKSHYVNFLNNNKPVTVVDKSSCDINVTVKNPMKLAQTDTSKSLALLEDPIFKYVEGVLFCRCCNTEVTCTEQFINTHLTGWRHKIKSSAMLAENGLRVDKDKICCDVCEIHLPNLNGITHIDSLSHKTKLSAKAVDNTAKTDEIKSDNCKNDEKNTEVQKSRDTNLLRAKKDKSKSVQDVFCDACKVYVLNMAVHLKGEHHKSVVKPKVVEKNYTCEICNVKVENKNLKQHENGAPHKNKLKTLLLKNNIASRDDNVMFCEFCDLFFTAVSLIKHVEGEIHKANCRKLETNKFCSS